jgi:hypothetical protein
VTVAGFIEPASPTENVTATREHALFLPERLLMPLTVECAAPLPSYQPVTAGIPLPAGQVTDADLLGLLDPAGTAVPLQTRTLARWKDGSAKWLLVDFLVPPGSAGACCYTLGRAARSGIEPQAPTLRVEETPQEFIVETGTATFHLNRKTLEPFTRIAVDGRSVVDACGTAITLRDENGRAATPQVQNSCVEEQGPVRATLRFDGTFRGRVPCRFVARICFFAGLGLVRLRFTLNNPQRARHAGGLWDLGDAGSLRFRDLSLQVTLATTEPATMLWQAEPSRPCRRTQAGSLEIYQASSGGDQWDSAVHVDGDGRVPCAYRGYRVKASGEAEAGLRASPVVALAGTCGRITAAVPGFWQQFPKALAADGRSLRVALFPEQFGDLFELQGGEQKTHTIWLDFASPAGDAALPLTWAHQPARMRVSPEWSAASGALAPFVATQPAADTPLAGLLRDAVHGPRSLAARREVIDEFGWRHFGEVYADHEGRYYEGPAPVISHFNNQYDVVYGTLLHYLRTGDAGWAELYEPLARHVMDIDIYHTRRDKAAYNGGLFWFTDHYKSAATCTHRSYSHANCVPGDGSYGGGPSAEHNFTTGLLHYYYLTGDPDARAAVLELADWVVGMDDGRRNVLGWLDDGPTGLATYTHDLDYHGPGRGAGNSINALLDAWLLTASQSYIDKAEALIRRCVHPADDVAARDLLNVEKRWSYTVFLSVLARYLRVKGEHEQIDFMYAYARASLLHYAVWMLGHEASYFDQPDKLEFPTEAWAAQELRKANVLRLAAVHTDGALRGKLMVRGQELADRAWRDLARFESRSVARALAIVMIEGLQDHCFRTQVPAPAPQSPENYDFGRPEVFVPQKHRVAAQLRSARGICRAFLRLANPVNWLGRCIRAGR